MKLQRQGIHLQYQFDNGGQRGAEIENPVFDLLSSLQEHGSIRHAAIARGRSYRYTWGELKQWEDVLGQALVQWTQGKRAALTPFAQRLLWAERQARVRMTPHIEALRAELANVYAQAQGGEHEVLEVFASHDLALPQLQALAAQQRRLHLALRFVGSEEALRSLRDGRCNVAGFHVPRLAGSAAVFSRALRPLLEPGQHKLIGSHRRQQGLMLRKGLSLPAGLRDVAERALRYVNRQAGSGTRLLADHLLHEAGLDAVAIDGYDTRTEHTHVAVAAAIAAGAADVGLGVEAAAREFGLSFVPLVEEDYYLACLKDALDTPAVQRLRQVLALPAWASAVSSLAGYAPQRSGAVLSLTRAIPWWRYRSSRREKQAAAA
jgi:putative molybdopterin biosynthesis protein